MPNIERFTFNPFDENTYVIHNQQDCFIVDPGCQNAGENRVLSNFIELSGTRLQLLLNTHCHLDHVLGNHFIHSTYGVDPWIHKAELEVLQMAPASAQMFGFSYQPSPEPGKFLEEGEKISVAGIELKTLFLPGHSPGHVAFYCPQEKWILGGDVLFRGGIGRTDLPGGHHQQLISSIKQKLFALPDDTVVYPGHGPETTLGEEKKGNPFLA